MQRRNAPLSPSPRWLRAVRAFGWCCVFLLSLLLGLILHADVPAFRVALAQALNRSLEGKFRGQLSLGNVEHLGATRARLSGLELLDERGASVLSLQRVSVGYHVWQWLGPLLFGVDAPLRLEHVRVEHARLLLASDAESGKWTLERALQSPRPPSGKPRRPPPRFALSEVELGDVDVTVEHPSVGRISANVQHLQGSAEIAGADTSVSVQRFGLRLVAAGDVPLSGTGSLRLLPHGRVEGTFHGFVDGTELDSALTFDAAASAPGATPAESELQLRVAVPRARPEQLRRRWPGWPLQSELGAELVASGPPRALRVEAQLNALASRFEARGAVALTQQPGARLELRGHALDARLFWPDAPATELEAQATLQLSKGPAGLLGELSGSTQPTQIAGVPLPGSTFSAQLAPRPEASLALGDARGHLSARLSPGAAGGAQLELQVSQIDLARWPQLQKQLRGRAELEARAELDGGRLTGTVRGQWAQLDAGAVRCAEGRLDGSVSGALDDWRRLELRAALNARELELGPLSFATASGNARGSPLQSSFEAALQTRAGAHSTLRGKLGLAETVSFRDLSARWRDRDLELAAELSYFSPAQRVLRIESVQISGAVGKLRGSGVIQPGSVDVRLDSEQLDAGRLARTFGAAGAGLSGRATGHVALSTQARDTRANVDLVLEQLGIRDVALGSFDLHGSLQERRLVASVTTRQSALGQLEARATGVLDGGALDSAAWRRAIGSASVSWKQLPLWPVGLALPKSGPVRDLAGQLDLALQLERAEAKAPPSAFLQASTRELSFSVAEARAETTFDQFTLHASASLDGASGHGAATVLLTDPHGALVTTSGSLQLDLAQLLDDPGRALEQLWRAPLNALMRLHARPLSQLPGPLSVAGVGGSVEGSLQLSGSLAQPTLELAFAGRDLLNGSSAGTEPLDVTGLLHFTPAGGQLSGRAEAARGNKSLISARLEGRLHAPAATGADDLLSLASWRPSELRAAAMLNGVPLELWPAAARERADAQLYGSVSLEQRGAEQRRSAQIEIEGLSVNGHALGNGRLSLLSDASGSRAELQLGSGSHRLAARLSGVAPSAQEPRPGLEGSVQANDFQVASLAPLVSGILSHLDGTLDANARVQLKRSEDQDWYLGINGEAELRGASAQLDLFGLQLRDLAAHVQARSTPQYTVLVIDPVEAKSRSRRDNVHGQAELWLEGVRVVNGEAELELDDVPLSVKSMVRGTARGRLLGQLERKPDYMALKVKVPELRVQLPAASTRTLIDLDPNREIHVGQESAPRAPRQSDALLWKMSFELGNGVRVERADLSIPLAGTPELDLQDEVRPSGTVSARPGGRLTLFDQNFSIDHGIVRFDPDAPDNPQVDVTASWRAPDGTTVFVDVTGHAKDASVLTRDDRGLQDVDRFYLLTGGATAASAVTGNSLAETGRGEAALGQTFSLGINQVLRQSLGNVAVSVGTSADDRASYSASVRLSDRLSFQGSFRPPSSENKREENTSDLTGSLDYQISRRWSLRTELGTTGAAFDLLWSHRY
ncbi:MAG TPA: translocation/assembly module TamB domain-containing protein [Polyangiaceae bacterium]|nr:translocation/assembly module TamB domain-containing protein [Polyangiaceae bacterium]